MQPKLDGLTIVALAVILFLGVNLLNDIMIVDSAALKVITPTAQPTTAPTPDLDAFSAPYTSYTLTQGLHGYDYGHLAIDLSAGEGAMILSPIPGDVTNLYTDEWGNPALTLENEIYQVTLLHGRYIVTVGQTVAVGDPIGYESNLGWTTDMAGNPCWGRSGCGYHTHLNVFDKRLGENINPLDLLSK